MSFYGLRNRLIQQQWQYDQEQQWRIKHEPPGFGSFALLPLEIRHQIYEACFPVECVEVDLVKVPGDRRLNCGLVSLMRSSRCIHDEIKPLLEKHMQSRLFNLVLSKKGVRFERNQFVIDFLTHERLQSMKSDTIPSLGVFSRTRKSIRHLRLAIQIAPSAVPAPGLVAILEPFAMWVFSLLSTAGALQFLLVEFHLSHEMATDLLVDNDDGSGKSIGKLIGALLGNRTAKHCQRVMEVALASGLQVVRVVILQKDEDESQQGRKVSSFRWNRPEGEQQQYARQLSGQTEAQPVSRSIPQFVPQRVSQEPTIQQPVLEHPAPQQPASDQPVSKEPVLEQSATEQPLSEKPVPEQPVLEKPVHEQSIQRVPHPLPQPTIQSIAALVHQTTAKRPEESSDLSPAKGDLPSVTARVGERNNSPEYSPPLPEVNTPALTHQTTAKLPKTSSGLSPTKGKLPSSAARVEEQSRSSEYSPPPPQVNKNALDHQQPTPELPTHHVPQPISQPTLARTRQPTAKRLEISSDLSHEKGNLLSSAARVEEKSSSPEYSPPPPQVRKDSLDHPTQPIEILDTSESPNKSADLPTTDPISPEARPSQAVLSRNLEQETSRRSQKKRKLDLGERASTTESQAGSSRKKLKRAASNSKPPSPAIEAASEKEEYVVKSLRDARIKNGVAEIQVKWKGYGPDQMTWEPRTTLMEDVPDMVREFDRRQPKLSKSGSRANSEQMSSKKSQKLTVKPSVEALQVGTETPRAATARMKQWASQQRQASQQLQASQKRQTEQQRQASPSASLPPKPKLASQAPPSASLSQKTKLASQASLSAPLAQKPKLASQAPKRPLTSYFLYMQANRPRLWDDLCKQLGNPELVTPARISTEGTRRWLHMDNEEKGVWDRIYAKRLAIYHIQMEAFKAGEPIPSQEEARSLVESSTKKSAVVDLT
jgi:hypothetical protein